ncbi:MAG TPA: hypothetical protein VK503_11300 [Candidatus Bathyarchaeia archaeon]|nr:hypothetical protein [Candidatus Bathyarchaeia archaeon]
MNSNKTPFGEPFGITNRVFTVTPSRVGTVNTVRCWDCAAPNENARPNVPKRIIKRMIGLTILKICCPNRRNPYAIYLRLSGGPLTLSNLENRLPALSYVLGSSRLVVEFSGQR